VLSETNDIGVSVIDTMQQQRESLLRSRDKVGKTNSLTEKARGIMRLMQARAITNKGLLVFVVILLMAMIGVVVYFGWVKEPPSNSSSK
jgi:vesicle transport through interaction with t-SNAREs protein 1